MPGSKVNYEVWVTFEDGRHERLAHHQTRIDAVRWSLWCLINGNGILEIVKKGEPHDNVQNG